MNKAIIAHVPGYLPVVCRLACSIAGFETYIGEIVRIGSPGAFDVMIESPYEDSFFVTTVEEGMQLKKHTFISIRQLKPGTE